MLDLREPKLDVIPTRIPHKHLSEPVAIVPPTFEAGEPMNYIKIAHAHVSDLYPVLYYGDIPLELVPKGTILGSWAYSAVGRFRIIVQKDEELAQGTMPADVARAWIRDQYELPVRRRKDQMERLYSAPSLARVGIYPREYAYVDVKGAYLNVLKLGWDVEYILGRYIYAEPRPVPVEVAKHKHVYSVSVSMAASRLSNLEMVGEYGTFTHQAMNLYSNPCVFNLAQESLNAVASEVMSVFGDKIIYINTDGYIIESEYVDPLIALIETWGLKARIREDEKTGDLIMGTPAKIYGRGSWTVGKYHTGIIAHAESSQNKLMQPSEWHWLKNKLASWYTDL